MSNPVASGVEWTLMFLFMTSIFCIAGTLGGAAVGSIIGTVVYVVQELMGYARFSDYLKQGAAMGAVFGAVAGGLGGALTVVMDPPSTSSS